MWVTFNAQTQSTTAAASRSPVDPAVRNRDVISPRVRLLKDLGRGAGTVVRAVGSSGWPKCTRIGSRRLARAPKEEHCAVGGVTYLGREPALYFGRAPAPRELERHSQIGQTGLALSADICQTNGT